MSPSFCSLSNEDDSLQKKISDLDEKCPGKHPVPQVGRFEETSLWGCLSCRQFDMDHLALTNINEEHCVGCGLYAISKDSQVGPLIAEGDVKHLSNNSSESPAEMVDS